MASDSAERVLIVWMASVALLILIGLGDHDNPWLMPRGAMGAYHHHVLEYSSVAIVAVALVTGGLWMAAWRTSSVEYLLSADDMGTERNVQLPAASASAVAGRSGLTVLE